MPVRLAVARTSGLGERSLPGFANLKAEQERLKKILELNKVAGTKLSDVEVQTIKAPRKYKPFCW